MMDYVLPDLLRDPGVVSIAVLIALAVLAFLWVWREPKYRSVEDMIREDGRRHGWIRETDTTTGPGEPEATSTTTPHEEA